MAKSKATIRKPSPLLAVDAERNFNKADTAAVDLDLVVFNVFPPQEPGDARLSDDARADLANDLITPERAQQYGRTVGRQLMRAVEDADEALAEQLAAAIMDDFTAIVPGEGKKESFHLGIGNGIEDVVLELEEGVTV